MTDNQALSLARLLIEKCCIEGIRNAGGQYQRLSNHAVLEAQLQKLLLNSEECKTNTGR